MSRGKSVGGTASGRPGPSILGGNDGPELSREDVFTVLAHRRRRYALHYLKDRGEPAELGELAEQVAAWENEKEPTEVAYRERKRAYSALQQSHLPVMDDAGIVEFDKERGVIEPTPALARVDVYLDVVHHRDIPWSEYYLGLAAVGAALSAALWLGVWPVALVSPLQWLVFLAVTLSVSAVAHVYEQRSQRLGGEGPPPEVVRDDPEPRSLTERLGGES